MKIAYIVLTCQKFESTRKVWQDSIVFSEAQRADVYFLGHRMNPDTRLYSWGAQDDYNSLPYKFADFFRYSGLDYDWYFLMDDDTFVYTDRLGMRVRQLEAGMTVNEDGGRCAPVNPRHNAYIEGHVLTHLCQTPLGLYHSGGAGTLLSAVVYHTLQQQFQRVSTQYQPPHWCADICLRVWTRVIHGLRFVHCNDYHPEFKELEEDGSTALTFHYLKEEKDFRACAAKRNCYKIDGE